MTELSATRSGCSGGPFAGWTKSRSKPPWSQTKARLPSASAVRCSMVPPPPWNRAVRVNTSSPSTSVQLATVACSTVPAVIIENTTPPAVGRMASGWKPLISAGVETTLGAPSPAPSSA